GVEHAREREPDTEDDAAAERDEDMDRPVHGETSLISVTVATPPARNVTTAAMERGENRARPTMPWPLVQPEPMRVPKPTSSPASTMTGSEAVMVTAGQSPASRR